LIVGYSKLSTSFFFEDARMKLTKKQSFYLSLIQSAEQNKQSIRQVAEQNNVEAQRLYAAVKTLRQKGALPSPGKRQDFVKLSLPAVMPDSRIELKTLLPNGQALWLNVAESQLHTVLRVLSA
jgi:transposase-like protein